MPKEKKTDCPAETAITLLKLMRDKMDEVIKEGEAILKGESE